MNRDGLRQVLVDVGVPLAAYYVLTKVFGMGEVAALALSSLVPAASAARGLIRDRKPHPLAIMMLVANAAGITLGLLTDDPRLILLKESAVTATIGLTVLVTAVAGRPLLSGVVRSALAKNHPAVPAAWTRLRETSAPFRRAELVFSLVWGALLFAECAVRGICVFTLPVDTMVWLGPVLMIATILIATALTRHMVLPAMIGRLRQLTPVSQGR
ncbi:hypothetical protein HFP15_36180 [Amycolatopsis sp. K13G38]|uniref:Intracellular septation protein A n=1 Tax=Amycolatopsis acididurans TaxID=2724524 RepID=A0ABX1JEX7_9PSEU|nr:VC0807 family protein [Amycolatopsis acididurans]NKQ58304.1 hypothetical protein [Amycolatopsis acididurans]